MSRRPSISNLSLPWWTAALLAAAGRVAAQAPDEGEDIRGPKALIEIPVPEKPAYELWLGIGGGLLLVAVAWFVWRRLRSGPKAGTPREVALACLTELESAGGSLGAQAFADRAAQTVRQYVADRFGLAAPRRTTEEFLRELAVQENSPLVAESDHLRVFLKSCDLAKFAGSGLDDAQRGDLLEAARGFIRSTSPAAAP